MPKSCTGSRYTGYSCTSSRLRNVASAVTGPGVTTWRLVSISPRSASTTKPVACAEVLRSVSNERAWSIWMATTLPAIRSSVAAQSAADASSPAPTTTGAGSLGVAAGGDGTGGSGGTTVALAPGAVAAAAAVGAAGAAGAAAHAAADVINAAQIAQAQSLNVIMNIQIPPESGREIHPHCSDAAACHAARS